MSWSGAEFANRSMHRLLATATYGPQPQRDDSFEISVLGAKTGREVSVAMTLADTEAVLAELDLNPCSYGRIS